MEGSMVYMQVEKVREGGGEGEMRGGERKGEKEREEEMKEREREEERGKGGQWKRAHKM